MSSEEDFSLVVVGTQPPEDSLEGIKALTEKYKEQYEVLLKDQKHIASCRDDQCENTKKFKECSEKLTEELKKDKKNYEDQLANEEMKLKSLEEEDAKLMKQIEEVEAALQEEEGKCEELQQQAELFAAVPEKKVIFTGLTGKEGDTQFEMKPHIVYPMDGGTALVTFEEEVVAKKILEMGKHKVNLNEDCKECTECSITVEARPIQLMLPELVEIKSEVCPKRILISNLPKMDTDTLLNKLEIHFSKTKNGGGEVDDREFLTDSGNVVLTFLKADFARGLADTEYHEVVLQPGKKSHRVRVTPFLNGNITNLKTKTSICPRTVLLTGIPPIMERDALQDLLEIHFQKGSNGGGEITAFLYNPLGQTASAIFKGVSEKKEEE
ncbi:interferon-induced protein 35 [Cheilinus undulatus]|uniref:interferon-induced protein 35 n=1 Tax=Cheilinus undulatus TaxID=241271 RepID=UPI001BD65469|nr:interferon-induced protein 35 [Cheilinus undulatus]